MGSTCAQLLRRRPASSSKPAPGVAACNTPVKSGGSSGVAKEVIRDLTSRGATVYAGCRYVTAWCIHTSLSHVHPHDELLDSSALKYAQTHTPCAGCSASLATHTSENNIVMELQWRCASWGPSPTGTVSGSSAAPQLDRTLGQDCDCRYNARGRC